MADHRAHDRAEHPPAPAPMEGPAWVIVNPKAGGGISQKKWARLVGAVSAGLGELEVRFTDARGHATEIAREAAQGGRRLVVAFGGDGTISEVAAGLLAAHQAGAPQSELGIIPRGTGGDFRRTLGLPTDITKAAQRIRDSAAHVIDAGRVQFTTPEGNLATRTFVNVASFGFSSTVAARANSASKALGAKAAFLGATVRTLMNYENADVMLELDGAAPIRRTVMLAAVGNGRFFGGGMKICPDAKLDSGALSLVIVGDLSKAKTLANIPRLFAGTHLALDEVRATTIHTLRATPADPSQRIPIELDGETPGYLPATFEVLPGVLPVRF
ncbi:MAG: diacylglycerol kinase family protein [Myxococcales bacterium]